MKKIILLFTIILEFNLFSSMSYDEFFQKVEILKEKIKNGELKPGDFLKKKMIWQKSIIFLNLL